ncbi:MAG: SIMPL domain-containing protein [Arcobacter sp.]|uniref:SIMPL domain-containing protein n=1 Tax=Arcobacter sp. TaxID=1872629 RepID=UPI003C7874B5
MKKSLQILGILGIFTSLSATTISLNESFTNTAKTTSYKINVSAENQSLSFNTIQNNMESILKKVKDLKEHKNLDCNGGKYSINPNVVYIDNKKETKGYISNINFTCTYDDTKSLNEFINYLNKSNINKTSIGTSNPILTEEEMLVSYRKLENQAFSFGIDYAKNLEKLFSDKSCSIKDINISKNQRYTPVLRNTLMEASALSKTSSIAKPIDDSLDVKINTNYTFLCK